MLVSSCAVVRWMVTECAGKLKSPVVKQKSFELERKRGTDGLSFFALEEKIEQRIRISARKRPLSAGLSKQQCPALTSSIESYDKHLKTPQKRRNRPNGQQKPGKVSSFTLFYSKKVTFYFIVRFYPSLF